MGERGIRTRLGGYQGPGSILTQGLQRFAELLPARFEVSVEADVPAAGATARSLFDSVQAGSREVCYVSSGYLSAQVPELVVLDLPFSVHDRGLALHTLDGPAGRQLAQAVRRGTGLQLLGYWDNGFRHLSNGRRAIRTPADCQGLTVRTLDSAEYRATMQALGLNAVTTDVRELRRAVASGEVDAQENPLTNFVNFELWRHHGHVSLTGHLFAVALFVCHADWFDALGAEAQHELMAAAAAATALERTLAVQEDITAREFLRSSTDVQVLEPDRIDLAAMQRCCAPLVSQWSARLPPELLAAYLQPPGSGTA
ncbi:MAG: TRAP transporter substrate-binding protein DctP [Rubrivivax sp.]|nr:TRAP transporter substrate-binding protein DctP [Rubrivivax sp.]